MKFTDDETITVLRFCRTLSDLETLCGTARGLGFDDEATLSIPHERQLQLETTGASIGAPVR